MIDRACEDNSIVPNSPKFDRCYRYNVLIRCATRVSPVDPLCPATLLCRACVDLNRMCSSTLSVTLRKSGEGRTQRFVRSREKNLPFPFSQRSHVSNLRQTIKGKGDSQEEGNRRCLSSCAPARRAAHVPAVRRWRILAEVQRKTSRPLGAKTLAQFMCPGQSVQGNNSFPIDTVGIPRYTYN